jgi:hypothetical protein
MEKNLREDSRRRTVQILGIRGHRHARERVLMAGIGGEQAREASTGAAGGEFGHVVVGDVQFAGFGVEFVEFVLWGKKKKGQKVSIPVFFPPCSIAAYDL